MIACMIHLTTHVFHGVKLASLFCHFIIPYIKFIKFYLKVNRLTSSKVILKPLYSTFSKYAPFFSVLTKFNDNHVLGDYAVFYLLYEWEAAD